MGDDLFQFEFTMESQLKWVLANGPWSFEDHPLALRRWKRGMTTTLVRFTSMPMWDQVWALPFEGKDVGRMFPQFVREVSHNTSFQLVCGQGFATVCVEDGLRFTHLLTWGMIFFNSNLPWRVN